MKTLKKIILHVSVILTLTLVITGCGKSYIQEGEITFDITYPYNTDLSIGMKAILPKEATLIFKGSKMLTIVKRGRMFRTDIYADEATKELEMRLDFGSDLFYTVLDQNDQNTFRKNLPNYTVTPTSTADSLKGLWAKKYTVKYDSDTVPEFESWFTEDLSLQNITWFSNYNNVVGVPLIYDIDQYGVRMHLEISGFKEREVKDSEFERSNELDQIDYDDYNAKLTDLFNTITGD
ncbi:MAG: hypothetical protein IPH66_08575 [Crocinitomicaceae bacterium]|nr:hypothetical protein [Crocinitomicaceae bacterium]